MTRRPLVYIAGPYRAPTESGVFENIMRARQAAIEVWRAGGTALCPHLNTAFFGGLMPDEVWLEGDLEMLRRCDGIMMLPGWPGSAGASKERSFAMNNGIGLFEHYDPFSDWGGASVMLKSWIASLPDRWSGR